MEKYTFRIYQEDVRIMLDNSIKGSTGHYAVLHRVLNYMKERRFEVGRDPEVQKRYKRLNKDHWYGRKGDLEFKAHRYPAGFEIQFYQNVVIENHNGGEYDFDKYQRMPYMIKLLFRNEVRHIKEFLERLGCVDASTPVYQYAMDKVKYNYVTSWHHPQKSMDEFELADLDGQTCEGSYNHTDRDKKIIYNGEIKYFRNRNGRLMRGKVYHNINNMWWVIINKNERINVADFYLFDPTEKDFKQRRVVKDRKPQSYLIRKEKIQEASVRELINELKRRGIRKVV